MINESRSFQHTPLIVKPHELHLGWDEDIAVQQMELDVSSFHPQSLSYCSLLQIAISNLNSDTVYVADSVVQGEESQSNNFSVVSKP